MSEVLLVNPRRRRRKTTTRKRTRARRKNPVRRRRRTTTKRVTRRRRRNPVGFKNVQGQVMTALSGAVGALGLDIALGYIPLPANMKVGIPGYLAKGVGAFGIGMLAGMTKMVTASTANKLTEGALTVVIHDALKQTIATQMPAIKLGEYLDDPDYGAALGYYGSGYNPESIDNGMGTYLPDLSADDLGMDETGLGEYLDMADPYALDEI